MESEVAQLILRDQPITYAVTDRSLRIVELGGDTHLCGGTQSAQQGNPIFALIPELIGHEQDIAEILNGAMPRFELPFVNREIEPDKILYTTLVNLPFSKPNGEITGLLTIVEDVSSAALTEQKMLQQRNELFLLRDEMRKQNQKLQHAISELQRLDDMKSQFISIAAHELRNPISTVLLYARMLLDDEAETLAAKHIHSIEVIYRNAERLTRITTNLLDLVRLDAGQMELVISPIDFSQIMEKLEADMQPILLERSQYLTLFLAPNLPTLLCDEERMLQILGNLLNNASKYSPKGTQITLRATLADDPNLLHLTISDQGMGIPAHEQPQLFQRFFRAINARLSNVSGSGLGLSIVRSLVELHSGKIWIESEVGQGTTVHLLLPVDTGEYL